MIKIDRLTEDEVALVRRVLGWEIVRSHREGSHTQAVRLESVCELLDRPDVQVKVEHSEIGPIRGQPMLEFSDPASA